MCQRRPGAGEEGLERVYQDRSLTCRDCTEEFSFSAGEQAFFASKGLTNDPQRCPSCRAAAKRARSNEGPREFHAAICGACGGQAVVPFAPGTIDPSIAAPASTRCGQARSPRSRRPSSRSDSNLLSSHEAGPETGRPRVIMGNRVERQKEASVGVIIIREMVGTSPRSWSDAARQAVATASKTVRNIVSVEVVKSTAVVRDGEIVEYHVEVKIGFEYEG